MLGNGEGTVVPCVWLQCVFIPFILPTVLLPQTLLPLFVPTENSHNYCVFSRTFTLGQLMLSFFFGGQFTKQELCKHFHSCSQKKSSKLKHCWISASQTAIGRLTSVWIQTNWGLFVPVWLISVCLMKARVSHFEWCPPSSHHGYSCERKRGIVGKHGGLWLTCHHRSASFGLVASLHTYAHTHIKTCPCHQLVCGIRVLTKTSWPSSLDF